MRLSAWLPCLLLSTSACIVTINDGDTDSDTEATSSGSETTESGTSDSGDGDASESGDGDAGDSDGGDAGDGDSGEAGDGDGDGTDSGNGDSGGDGDGDGDASFACGDSLSCNLMTQYCSILHAGPVGVPPNHSCNALPDACETAQTCACLESELAEVQSGDCTGDASSGLTVQIYAP